MECGTARYHPGPMSDRTRELSVALSAVRVASAACRAVQSEIDGAALEKSDRSPVTVADFAAQAVVCRALAAAFPDDPVIAEEDADALRTGPRAAFLDRVVAVVNAALEQEGGVSADADAVCGWIDRGGETVHRDRFWTLDPIDGTKGFLRGGQYAVALALVERGEIVLGVLGCPNLPPSVRMDAGGELPPGVLLSAIQGGGSTERTLWEEDATGHRIATSEGDDPTDFRLVESVESGHSKHDRAAAIAAALGITADPVRLDSQAKYAVVARGEADVYLRLPTRPGYVEKIWDHAAGVLVVTEAGGTVTDTGGKPLEFRHGRGLEANAGVVATNGRRHDAVVAAVRASA